MQEPSLRLGVTESSRSDVSVWRGDSPVRTMSVREEKSRGRCDDIIPDVRS